MSQSQLKIGDLVLQIPRTEGGESPPACCANYLGVVVDVFEKHYSIMFLTPRKMNQSLRREEILDLQINVSKVFSNPGSCHENRTRILDAYHADILASLIKIVFDYEGRVKRILDS